MSDQHDVEAEEAVAPPGPDDPVDEVEDDAGDAPVASEADVEPELDEATSVEELIALLEATAAERDQYLDLARRTQAEFENHRKRAAKQLDDEVTRKVAELVEQLLPVLDACDGAVLHGATEVEPIFAALLQALGKRGLERIDPLGHDFDPTWHEAVMHEPGDEGQESTVVSDVMRAGYAWQGRVIRPAMVKVKG
ncbi:nucleotide exchange factor GrpE [Aquihabitans sp. McL0605]|uniref:nucleotide exchange factor GrpE n=1 Tax=Aquihabitans sp. McL0605 TaxID=3415671 RepID=UPI003CFA0518